MVCKGRYCIFIVLPFSSRENDSSTLRVDAFGFENGREIPFSYVSGYVWTGSGSEYCQAETD